jgi:hypothetical protein
MIRSILSSILLLSLAASARAACKAEHAIYKHMEDANFSIIFSLQPQPKSWSNILATLQTPSRKLDFEFTESNGYGMQYLVLVSKGAEQNIDINVNLFDNDLKAQLLPQAGEQAPEFIIAPVLGQWLYYSKLEPQEFIPQGIWKFSSCNK